MGTVELPSDQLKAARAELLAQVTGGDSTEARLAYASLVGTISHPAAVLRLRVVRGVHRLQLLLNAIILWRWLCWALYLAIAWAGIQINSLFFVAIPVVFVVNMVAVNPLQSRINIELAARLAVLDRVMDEDCQFRKRVLALMEQTEEDGR